MRARDHKRRCCCAGRRRGDRSNELVDVSTLVGAGHRGHIKRRIHRAGDGAAAGLDRTGQVEVHAQADRNSAGSFAGNRQRTVEDDVDRGRSKRCGFRSNARRRCRGIQVADGRRSQLDGDTGVSSRRNAVHIHQALQTVVTGKVNGGWAAEQVHGVSARVHQLHALELNLKRDDRSQWRIGADQEGRAARCIGLGSGCHRGTGATCRGNERCAQRQKRQFQELLTNRRGHGGYIAFRWHPQLERKQRRTQLTGLSGPERLPGCQPRHAHTNSVIMARTLNLGGKNRSRACSLTEPSPEFTYGGLLRRFGSPFCRRSN